MSRTSTLDRRSWYFLGVACNHAKDLYVYVNVASARARTWAPPHYFSGESVIHVMKASFSLILFSRFEKKGQTFFSILMNPIIWRRKKRRQSISSFVKKMFAPRRLVSYLLCESNDCCGKRWGRYSYFIAHLKSEDIEKNSSLKPCHTAERNHQFGVHAAALLPKKICVQTGSTRRILARFFIRSMQEFFPEWKIIVDVLPKMNYHKALIKTNFKKRRPSFDSL